MRANVNLAIIQNFGNCLSDIPVCRVAGSQRQIKYLSKGSGSDEAEAEAETEHSRRSIRPSSNMDEDGICLCTDDMACICECV